MAARVKKNADIRQKKNSKSNVSPESGVADDQRRLGLDETQLDARMTAAEVHALQVFALVRPRFEEVYKLKLPIGLAHLYALFHALGELPENPEGHYWQPESGFERGGAWMDAALSVRSSGLLEWFAPGGLDRQCFRVKELVGKGHGAASKGKKKSTDMGVPLDARLDMRYRCDAPQFVTFLGGDSDGLHWGFWYDSPAFFPVIAHNYARDSAETWLDGEASPIAFLRVRTTEMLEENAEELELLKEENEARPYAMRRQRALRVVESHIHSLERVLSKRSWPEEAHCPWPRTKSGPVGSPSLALKPETGVVPSHIPGVGKSSEKPSVQKRKAWLKEARTELEAGRPAYAHVLGLYLHWLDGDELREEAGQLLIDAYKTLGFDPFAEILELHLRYRDLPTVAVFRDSDGGDE